MRAVRDGVRAAAGDGMRRAMGDARRRGVHEPFDRMRAAGGDDVVGPNDVGAVVAVVTTPRAGLGGVVEDRLASARRGDHRIAVGEVALALFDLQRIQRRMPGATEAAHVVAARDQAPAQRLAEEATTTGDEEFHRRWRRNSDAAHRASVSRPILALWRMSTGKRGCNRNVPIVAVCTKPLARCRSSSTMPACCAFATPAFNSTQSTGVCAPDAPTPTSALRRTSGCTSNTGSTCSVHNVLPSLTTT